MMKIGDLVRCRPRNERENYDAWLGLIIGEPTNGTHKTVQWVCSDGRGDVETVNHTPEELWVVNESR
jgi:hypothetical protein